MKSQKIICFGEILWDLFPDGKKLGGAPINVASSLKNLGADVEFISRIGNDSLGKELLMKVKNHGVSISHIQKDAIYSTGEVQVNLKEIISLWDRLGIAFFQLLFVYQKSFLIKWQKLNHH